MTAKEYLLEIRTMRRTLHTLEQQAEDLRTRAEGLRAIVYDKDRVQVSVSNQLEKIIPRLIEADTKYAEALIKYKVEILRRTQQIKDIGRDDYAEILRLRYVEEGERGRQLTLEEIAVMLHRSFSWVRHLHGKALQSFAMKYKLDTQKHIKAC